MKINIRPYLIGFGLSLLFTFTAFALTYLHESSYHKLITHEVLIPALLTLAVTQLIIQSIFFLHLKDESGPRWNLTFYVSTIFAIIAVIVGSLWIMGHLNYNMMPPGQMGNYIMSEEAIHK